MGGQTTGMPGEQLPPTALANNPDTGPAPGTCTRNKQLKYKTPSDGIFLIIIIFLMKLLVQVNALAMAVASYTPTHPQRALLGLAVEEDSAPCQHRL